MIAAMSNEPVHLAPIRRSRVSPPGPVILLGAARSGTKLLRSIVAASGQFAEVPYDVNFAWRYGRESWAHDALPVESLRPRTARFLRRWLPHTAGLPEGSLAFVEKTVGNTLRPDFVRAVFPEARYIAIVRDGRDVVRSAERCWREPPDAAYLVEKLRIYPWRQCAHYAAKYAIAVAGRASGLSNRVRTWGPRYPGIDEDLRQLTLTEVCARQWAASIESYERARGGLGAGQLLELCYESLLSDPESTVRRLCEFLGVDCARAVEYADRVVRPPRSHAAAPFDESGRAYAILRPVLGRWGYLAEAETCEWGGGDRGSIAKVRPSLAA